MGAPKLKWTPEEEIALRAGVNRHGSGKWRTILSDTEFGSVLKSRSNVDLKDKWRNLLVTGFGGSRKNVKLSQKKTLPSGSKQVGNNDTTTTTAVTVVAEANGDDGGQQIVPTSPPPPPPSGSSKPPRAFKGSFTRVDNMILEAVTKLNKPSGPNGKSILLYIEKNSKMQPDMKRVVTSRLKYLTNAGTLLKIKHKYSISPNYTTAGAKQRSSQLLLEGNKENSPKPEEIGVQNLTIGELSKIKGKAVVEEADAAGASAVTVEEAGSTSASAMTVEEAAAASARAVAEAEIAIAEAAEAAREADEAEALAEAAQIIAIAAMEALNCRMQGQTH